MSEQFLICTERPPSFGRGWVIRVRSWRSSKGRTCGKRAAGGSSRRAIFSPQAASRSVADQGRHWRSSAASTHDPQHFDRPLAIGEEPQPGSHLISPRRGYTHHGIYVGDGKVVHYGGLARGQFRGCIEEVSLAQFAHGRSVWTRTSNLAAFVPQEVIRRARSRVGENRYRILRNNCEHFCEWCLRGESRSYQVERFFSSSRPLDIIVGVISSALSNRSPSENTGKQGRCIWWQVT
jgi:Lecithin retinol acyltransferase